MTKPKESPKNCNSNKCSICALACGGCEWSEVDPETNKIAYKQVPGWIAEPSTIGKDKNGDEIQALHITFCPKFKPMRRNATQRHFGAPPRPVIGTDVNGEDTRYASITEAGKAIYVNFRNIWAACNGKAKTAGGYKWRYAD